MSARSEDEGGGLRPATEAPGPSARAARVEGIDVARGLASAIMIQGHAYDGWVDAEGKATEAYAFTRLLGTLPLPSFLLLSGAALALRVEAGIAKGEDAAEVRRALARRGLEIVAIGYAVNTISALMDGWEGPETFFRADVLPLIGLCIATLAMLGVRGPAAAGPTIDRRVLVGAAAALAVIPIAICPWVSAWSRNLEGPAGWALGLFVDVPGVTRMPFVPLAGWCGAGVLLGAVLAWANREVRSVAGASPRVLAALLAAAIAIAVAFTEITRVWVEASGVPLDRTHPAVVTNAIELAARGVIVLAVGALSTPLLPPRARAVLLRLGRGSLVAYVFHVPFCYGALGLPIRGRLSMLEATGFVVLLEIASFGAVWARDTLRSRAARPR
ncbi:MAG: heparan-alpha-glucosaminide N-acetyltransferase domain-containing protein [Deltaproteobacteria bacterium]